MSVGFLYGNVVDVDLCKVYSASPSVNYPCSPHLRRPHSNWATTCKIESLLAPPPTDGHEGNPPYLFRTHFRPSHSLMLRNDDERTMNRTVHPEPPNPPIHPQEPPLCLESPCSHLSQALPDRFKDHPFPMKKILMDPIHLAPGHLSHVEPPIPFISLLSGRWSIK
jgi:hypothetical protein